MYSYINVYTRGNIENISNAICLNGKKNVLESYYGIWIQLHHNNFTRPKICRKIVNIFRDIIKRLNILVYTQIFQKQQYSNIMSFYILIVINYARTTDCIHDDCSVYIIILLKPMVWKHKSTITLTKICVFGKFGRLDVIILVKVVFLELFIIDACNGRLMIIMSME